MPDAANGELIQLAIFIGLLVVILVKRAWGGADLPPPSRRAWLFKLAATVAVGALGAWCVAMIEATRGSIGMIVFIAGVVACGFFGAVLLATVIGDFLRALRHGWTR